MKKMNLKEQADAILKLAEESGLQSNYFFVTTFERYQVQLQILDAELNRTGVKMDAVKERYNFDKPEHMSEELYEKVMQALAKTKSVKAA